MKSDVKSNFFAYMKSKDKVPEKPTDEVAGEDTPEPDMGEGKCFDIASALCDALDVHPDKAGKVASVLLDMKDHFNGVETDDTDPEY